MLKKIARFFLPNPFDRLLKRCKGKKILLAWNRGLGDIALGLYAMVERIRKLVPDAEITFLIRENLREGFSLLEGVQTIEAPFWKRGEPYDVWETLKKLHLEEAKFDLVIEKPSPTDWVRWQLGKVVPKLRWSRDLDHLWKKFDLPEGFVYIGIQAVAETSYGLWRNWPEEKWKELFVLLEQNPQIRVLLFGFGSVPPFEHPMLIDLRGKTSLLELISVIKNRCDHLIVPDSGILSMVYYLDEIFPIQVISLWADPHHGVLKQGVLSPNPLLTHSPLIGKDRDLSTVSAREVYDKLFPLNRPFSPLKRCTKASAKKEGKISRVGCLILAGGQGTRLGFLAPKGLFSIHGKTLFERIVEKIPKQVPIAIMTSPSNHQETVAYFDQHQQFERNIFFFEQSTLPLLDEKKKPLGIEGPDGNGSFYRRFVETGGADYFARLGIEIMTLIPVDNALANPLDPAFLSFHREEGVEVSIRCIERSAPRETMGVLIERDGKIEVLEYCNIDLKELSLLQEDGRLKYLYAYTGLAALNLSFIRKAAKFDLPLHWVGKEVMVEGKKVLAWKGEKFLFDAFVHADSIAVLCSPREECYAPLKSKEGPNGIEAVKRALLL